MRRNTYKRHALRSARSLALAAGATLSRVWRPVLALLLVATLYQVGSGLLKRSHHFAVRKIDVNETQRVTREELLSLTHLDIPQNLLNFDARTAESALSEHPWVASAQVDVRLPGTVSIQITERQPAAVVSLGSLYVVDGSGEPFVRALPGDVESLPLITGIDRVAYEENPQLIKSWVRNALALGRLYGHSPLAENRPLGNVNISEGGRLELMLDRTRIVMGYESFPLKLERLARIYDDLSKRKSDAAWILLDEEAERAVVKEIAGKRSVMGSL